MTQKRILELAKSRYGCLINESLLECPLCLQTPSAAATTDLRAICSSAGAGIILPPGSLLAQQRTTEKAKLLSHRLRRLEFPLCAWKIFAKTCSSYRPVCGRTIVMADHVKPYGAQNAKRSLGPQTCSNAVPTPPLSSIYQSSATELPHQVRCVMFVIQDHSSGL